MKLKILTFALIFCNIAFSQQRLNALISVNNVVAGSFNLSNSSLLVQNDTIKLKYEMGRFEIADNDIEKLRRIDKEEEVYLSFNYHETCPAQKKYTFRINLKLNLLLQEYLFVKVYAFESYPKAFVKNTGYGFEYLSPLGGSVLPKNKKFIHHKCSD